MAQRDQIIEGEYQEVDGQTPRPHTTDTKTAKQSIREYQVSNADKMSSDDEELIGIRTEIATTRRETRETLKAIQDQLTPRYLRNQAQDKVREMTVDRAKDAANTAKRKVKSMSSNIFDTMRDNWLPTAMITAGIAWLVKENRNSGNGRDMHSAQRMAYGEGPRYYEWEDAPDDQFRPRNPYQGEPIPERGNGRSSGTVKEGVQNAGYKATHAASRAGEKSREAARRMRDGARSVGEDARDQYRRARRGFFEELQENPLAIAGAAMAIGAVFGLAIPETEYENEMMGEYRDDMVHEAKRKGQDTFEKAQHVAEHAAEEAMSAAKEESQRQDLTT